MTSAESEGAAAAAPEPVAEPVAEVAVKSDFVPTILVFSCNWCSYTSADLAGVSRLQYPPNFRVIRVPCSGRVSPKFILAAFRHGSDGVWVSG